MSAFFMGIRERCLTLEQLKNMVKRFLIFVTLIGLVYSCNQQKEVRPQTAIDTGREFIRASLDGKFDAAEKLLLKDTQNIELFESYKTYYSRLAEDKKQNYKSASYNINKYQDVDDSTVIINYSNSYMNKPMEIKLVRRNNEWDVDFKYMYSEN